jgi:hypothetical protein
MALQLARQACAVIREQASAISGPRPARALSIELADVLMHLAAHSTNSTDADAHQTAILRASEDSSDMLLPSKRDESATTAAGFVPGLLQVAHEAVSHAWSCHDAACGGPAQLTARIRALEDNKDDQSITKQEAATTAREVSIASLCPARDAIQSCRYSLPAATLPNQPSY